MTGIIRIEVPPELMERVETFQFRNQFSSPQEAQYDFLNDRSEYIYAIEVVKAWMGERGVKRAVAAPASELLDFSGKLSQEYPHYIASFCASGDLLSQWRGYAQTNDGYAIGFDFKELFRKVPVERGAQLAPITYNREEQFGLLDKSLLGASNSPSSSASHLDVVRVEDIMPLLLRFKHPSFESEHEWRLVERPSAIGKTKDRFRALRGHIVPYIEIPLGKTDIAEIIQGPGLYRPRNPASIKRFATSRGFDVRVELSQTPYVGS